MRLREGHLQPTGGRRGLDISRRSVSEGGSWFEGYGQGQNVLYIKRMERDRPMVDMIFAPHGWDARVQSVSKQKLITTVRAGVFNGVF